MKNKKGQGAILMAILVAGMIFVAGVLFINHIRDLVINVSSIDMECGNINNSDGAKLTCLIIDLVVPYLIIIFLASAGGVITARLTL